MFLAASQDCASGACLQVPISVVNGQFFGTNGQPVTLKGVNWFGFETSATMVSHDPDMLLNTANYH